MKQIAYDRDEHGRIETGPIQIGSDWPGIFIRGDNVGDYIRILRYAAERFEEEHNRNPQLIYKMIETLKSCWVKEAT